MTDKEFLTTTDWHNWRKEKSRNVIEYLASALTCRQTPKSRRAISWAIYDAAKLFTLELELEAGRAFRGLHVGIRRAVMRSPQTATEYLDETVRRLIPKAR